MSNTNLQHSGKLSSFEFNSHINPDVSLKKHLLSRIVPWGYIRIPKHRYEINIPS